MRKSQDGAGSVRVFLVDDHELVRQGLRALLDTQPDLEWVGEAGSYAEAIARLPLADPDVVVADLQLPDGSGSDICRHLASHQPSARCLVLSSFSHDSAVFDAVRAGAAGYVVKHIDNRDLLSCIRRVAAGETLLDPRSREAMSSKARAADADERLSRLTSQERTLLRHLADGMTNREIGERMFLSDKTVKNYVSAVLAKLGVTRRAAAAAYYQRTVSRRDWAADAEELRRGAVRF